MNKVEMVKTERMVKREMTENQVGIYHFVMLKKSLGIINLQCF